MNRVYNFIDQLDGLPPAKNIPFPDQTDSSHIRLNYVKTRPNVDNSFILSANGCVRVMQYRQDNKILYVYRTSMEQGIHLYLKNNERRFNTKVKYPELAEITLGHGKKVEVMMYMGINADFAHQAMGALRTILTGTSAVVLGHHTTDMQVFYSDVPRPATSYAQGVLWRVDNRYPAHTDLSYVTVKDGVLSKGVHVASFTDDTIVIEKNPSLVRATQAMTAKYKKDLILSRTPYVDESIVFELNGDDEKIVNEFIGAYTGGIKLDYQNHWEVQYQFIFQGTESFAV